MNNFTLTDYKEYLAGTLTKRPERVRFTTTRSIFLADLTGLVGADLSFVELERLRSNGRVRRVLELSATLSIFSVGG